MDQDIRKIVSQTFTADDAHMVEEMLELMDTKMDASKKERLQFLDRLLDEAGK